MNGDSVIRNPAVYRLRAMEMLSMRVHGRSYTEIATTFDISEATVMRSLKWAEREGLVEDYENKIISSLVPEAIKVYAKALENNDTFVAKDIINQVFKLGERFSNRQQKQEELTLESHFEQKRLKLKEDKHNHDQQRTEPVIDITPGDYTVNVGTVETDVSTAIEGGSGRTNEPGITTTLASEAHIYLGAD